MRKAWLCLLLFLAGCLQDSPSVTDPPRTSDAATAHPTPSSASPTSETPGPQGPLPVVSDVQIERQAFTVHATGAGGAWFFAYIPFATPVQEFKVKSSFNASASGPAHVWALPNRIAAWTEGEPVDCPPELGHCSQFVPNVRMAVGKEPMVNESYPEPVTWGGGLGVPGAGVFPSYRGIGVFAAADAPFTLQSTVQLWEASFDVANATVLEGTGAEFEVLPKEHVAGATQATAFKAVREVPAGWAELHILRHDTAPHTYRTWQAGEVRFPNGTRTQMPVTDGESTVTPTNSWSSCQRGLDIIGEVSAGGTVHVDLTRVESFDAVDAVLAYVPLPAAAWPVDRGYLDCELPA